MEPVNCNIYPIYIGIIGQCFNCHCTSSSEKKKRNHRSLIGDKRSCPITDCGKQYARIPNLENHILNYHFDTGLKYVKSTFYQCGTCDFRNINKRIVLQHTKNKIRQSNFECYNCHQQCNSKKDLIDHFNSHPTDDSTYYQCSECVIFITLSKYEYDLHVLGTPECRTKNLKYVTHGSACM